MSVPPSIDVNHKAFVPEKLSGSRSPHAPGGRSEADLRHKYAQQHGGTSPRRSSDGRSRFGSEVDMRKRFGSLDINRDEEDAAQRDTVIPTRFKYALDFDDDMREGGTEIKEITLRQHLHEFFHKSQLPAHGRAPGEMPTFSERVGEYMVAKKKRGVSGNAKALLNVVTAKIFILQWIRTYQLKEWLKVDIAAGFTIAAMLVPQGMAYAMVAGLPPIYGLYSAFMPQIVYALTGSSRHLSVGPVAILSLLQASGMSAVGVEQTIGGDPNPVYIKYCVTTAFIAGVIQCGMSVLNLGFLLSFLSHPVISGFTSASAIVIAMSQLSAVLGFSFEKDHNAFITIYNAAKGLRDGFHWQSFVMAAAAFIVLMAFKKIPQLKKIPAALVLVVAGTLLTWGLDLNAKHDIKITGDIPKGLPAASVPSTDPTIWSQMFPTAIAMSLIGLMESNAVAKIYAQKFNYQLDNNQELFALGTVNLFGSFFSCYPCTGSFSRTAVNAVAGAKTLISALFSAAAMLLVLLFLTPLFYHLPKPILGSIVFAGVLNLFDTHEPRYLWSINKGDFCVLVGTFFACLILGVEIGLGLAVGFSVLVIVFRSMYPSHAVLGRLPGTSIFRNILRYPQTEKLPGVLIYRFDKSLHFANVGRFVDIITNLLQNSGQVTEVVLDFSAISDIDSSAVHALSEFLTDCHNSHRRVYIASAKGPCRDIMRASGLMAVVGEGNFYVDLEDAVEAAEEAESEVTGVPVPAREPLPSGDSPVRTRTLPAKSIGNGASAGAGIGDAGDGDALPALAPAVNLSEPASPPPHQSGPRSVNFDVQAASPHHEKQQLHHSAHSGTLHPSGVSVTAPATHVVPPDVHSTDVGGAIVRANDVHVALQSTIAHTPGQTTSSTIANAQLQQQQQQSTESTYSVTSDVPAQSSFRAGGVNLGAGGNYPVNRANTIPRPSYSILPVEVPMQQPEFQNVPPDQWQQQQPVPPPTLALATTPAPALAQPGSTSQFVSLLGAIPTQVAANEAPFTVFNVPAVDGQVDGLSGGGVFGDLPDDLSDEEMVFGRF